MVHTFVKCDGKNKKAVQVVQPIDDSSIFHYRIACSELQTIIYDVVVAVSLIVHTQ